MEGLPPASATRSFGRSDTSGARRRKTHTLVVATRRGRWWRTALGASTLVLTLAASCSSDGQGPANGAEPPASSAQEGVRRAPGSGPSADVAVRAIQRALLSEQSRPPACVTFDERLERVRSTESASAELEHALLSSAESKGSLAIAVSAFQNAYSALPTCVELSAEQHSGTPEAADCRVVVAEFDRAVAELREEAREATP